MLPHTHAIGILFVLHYDTDIHTHASQPQFIIYQILHQVCFLILDLTDKLGKITCPVLALNGTKDRQVNSEENLNALRSGLAGEKEIKAIVGLNHMFQHCNTGDPTEYKDIEETFAPEALDIITTWLKRFK